MTEYVVVATSTNSISVVNQPTTIVVNDQTMRGPTGPQGPGANDAYAQANAAYAQANAAYAAANSASSGGGAYNQANSAYSQANTARTTANDSYGQANTARDTANGAYAQANGAYAQANGAYAQANGAYAQANGAYAQANLKVSLAGDTMTGNLNVAATIISQNIVPNLNVTYSIGTPTMRFKDLYVGGNTIYIGDTVLSATGDEMRANTFNASVSFLSAGLNVLDQANSARNQANTARNQANSARNQANTAYDTANLKLNLTGGTITGDLTVSGNLFVSGANTLLNVTNLTVNDSIIFLANGQVGDVFDIGFVGHFDRSGTTTHAGLFRRATDNRFYLFDNYEVEPSNNIIDINGNNFRTGNLKLNTLNADSFVTTAGLNVTDQANTARDQANTARDTANGAYGQANGAYAQANGAYAHANIVYAQANTARDQANSARDQANTARDQANTARNQANTARITANDAYAGANTANTNALNAYSQANTARDTANSAYAAANSAGGNAKITANSGSQVSTANINFVNTSTVTVSVVSGDNGNANVSFTSSGGGGGTIAAPNTAILVANVDGAANGTNNFIFNVATNFLGVGTNTPNSNITVAGNVWVTTGINVATINITTANVTNVNGRSSLAIGTGTGSNGNVLIHANGVEVIRVINVGRVGVFSTTPNSNVVVVGNAWITTNLTVSTNITTATFNATTANLTTTVTPTLNAINANITTATIATGNVTVGNVSGNLFVGGSITTGGSNGDISNVNTIYASTFSSGGINITAQAAAAYGAANNAANTVRVSQNSGSTLSAKQLNFVNTANVTVTVTDSGDGNANVAIFSAGGGNTANVTFQDNIVIGTGVGQNDGLYLAAGAGQVANLQYLRLRGGDDDAHIHFDTANVEAYDLYIGDDNKYVKLERGYSGNIIIGSSSNYGKVWKFDIDGNTVFPNITQQTIHLGTRSSIKYLDDQIIKQSGNAAPDTFYTITNQEDDFWETYTQKDVTGGNSAWSWIISETSDANAPYVIIETKKLDSPAKTWLFDENGALANPVLTYSNLPAATTAGIRAFISDANNAASGNFGAVVGGGGANTVPVFSDGTDWRIG